MFNLITKINKSQLREESAKIIVFPNANPNHLKDEKKWYKDLSVIKKVKKVADKQQKRKQPPKTNAGRFQKGNKYVAKPNPKKAPANPNVSSGKKVGGQLGVKRKGRLPSKTITNSLGRRQTVYYRPDKKTKSKYIDPDKMSIGSMMDGYRESFKRMLFLDHDNVQNWRREKGADRHAWGADMVNKLDSLADKYGFDFNNFDQTQDKMVRGDFKGVDQFLQEAENIYGEMYKTGEKHPFEFLQNIFDATRQKISTRHNPEGVNRALAEWNLVPIVNVPKSIAPKMPPKKNKTATAPKNKNTNTDDDDEKNNKNTIPRNVDAVMNDSKYVRAANDFINKYNKF